MATSKPEFQGKVLKHASSNNYCGLYKRRLINTSGAVATQYYWLPTSQIGEIVDQRGNIMNGTFASAEIASELANAPAGYGNYVDNWQNERYNSLMISYPFDPGNGGVPTYKATIDDWLSKCPEINNLVLPVFWGDVFDSYAEQTANAEGSWTQINDLVTFLKSKNSKVSILLCLFLGSSEVDNFWGYDNNEKDEWNTVVSLEYGNAHPSLADKSSGSGRSMMKDFFQKVVTRYGSSEWLGSQFGWISPVITGQMEYGYNFGDKSSGGENLVMEGYHQKTTDGFRIWLNSELNPNRYENIEALNARWGTNYDYFTEVMPPKTNQSFRQANINHFAAMFSTNSGRDFWKYMAQNLYDFANELRTITYNNSSAKFVISLGGVSPNDKLVLLRCTYDVLKLGEVCDGLKTAFGMDSRNNTGSLTLDYVQNYPNKKQTELQHIDYTIEGQDNWEAPDIIKPRMIESGRKAIENGAKDLMFISIAKNVAHNSMMQEVCKSLVSYTTVSRNTEGRTATVRLEELLSSAGQRGLGYWVDAGGGNNNRVAFTFLNSSGDGGGNLPYVLALYPEIQTYYLRDPDTKNSKYGRVAIVNEVEVYNELQLQYNATKVPFLVPSHGITYPTGLGVAKTRSIITITDNNGVVWVKCVQTMGVNPFENGVNYSNNHIELRFTNATEDGRFWLPRSASYYEISIQVFDAPCRFQVDHADTDGPTGEQYHEQIELSAGATHTFTVPSSKFNQENVNHRVIKINNNRWV